MAGWGFAGRDRKSRPTWTQITSTSMPYAVTPRYQRASWPSIARIVSIFSVDIIIIAITTHAIKIHSINIMMIDQIGFTNLYGSRHPPPIQHPPPIRRADKRNAPKGAQKRTSR